MMMMMMMRSSAVLEPVPNAQELPDHGPGPIAMRCWVEGGVMLGNGESVHFQQIVGSWHKVVGEDRVLAEVGEATYIGDWKPYSTFLQDFSLQPCVVTMLSHHPPIPSSNAIPAVFFVSHRGEIARVL